MKKKPNIKPQESRSATTRKMQIKRKMKETMHGKEIEGANKMLMVYLK